MITEKVLKSKELAIEKEEHDKLVQFASDYIVENVNFDEYLTREKIADMLKMFKRKFVDKEWYNAGIMAQRILQNDEIETLKKKLKQEEFNHVNTRISWDSTTEERDELKHRCKALEDRIKIITEKYNINV